MSADPVEMRKGLLALLAIIIAGEMIFGLCFHVPRYFRPSMLEAFELTNAQLGDVFAVYGVTAMLAYFPGGALADRFGARGLMVTSLLATALGGGYFATFPSGAGLALLYGYWGVTTIFLFWAAMIRATRQWGGADRQGRAFGLLDGGRGLAAAGFASAMVAVFVAMVPDAAGAMTQDERRAAMQLVIVLYSAMTVAAAGLVWWWLPRDQGVTRTAAPPEAGANLVQVLSEPLVWLQAAIVICAYCAYKGLDNYGLYLHQVVGLSEAEAAGWTASAAYLRPLAAVAAGFVADRLSARNTIMALFAVLAASYVALTRADPGAAAIAFVYANLLVTFACAFALRGVYFALLQEIRIPFGATGTAVGLVSVIGYTPDIFFAPIAGRLLDASPGLAGHQHYFALLAMIAIVGAVTAAGLAWRVGSRAGAAALAR